jgi:flagellar hook-associated protein 2
VIDVINGLSVGVEAKINDAGDGIVLVDTAGGTGTLTVVDVGSGTAARDLHLAGTAEDGQIDGTTTFTVAIDAEDTLDDLIAKINGLNAGVTAGVLSQSSGSLPHHLTLLSGTAGKAGELVIDGAGAGLAFQDLAPAQDAVLQFGTGLAATLFTSTTNQFKSVLEGLDVSIFGSSSDPVTVSVTQTGEAAANAIQTFVDNYNKLREKLKTYTAYDPAAGTKGTLFGSSEALRIDTEISRILTARYFGVGDVQSLGELGVAIDDQGRLALDQSKFLTRYAADPDAVVEFFTNETAGFAVKADAVFERLVGRDNSALVNRGITLNRQVENNNERLSNWDRRLERQRDRLTNQFYQLELVVSRIRNNLTSINQIQAFEPLTSRQN